MVDNSEVQELMEKKEAYIRQIKEKGKMTAEDAGMLRRLEGSIFMAKHPRIKKFDRWLHPKAPDKSDIVTKIKYRCTEFARFLVTFPIAIPHNYLLNKVDSMHDEKVKNFAAKLEGKPTPRGWKKVFGKIGKFMGAPTGMLADVAANAAADALKNESNNSQRPPMDPELKRILQGLGEKPKAPVSQTQVDGNIVSGMGRREL